jgi:hypothetical protein
MQLRAAFVISHREVRFDRPVLLHALFTWLRTPPRRFHKPRARIMNRMMSKMNSLRRISRSSHCEEGVG